MIGPTPKLEAGKKYVLQNGDVLEIVRVNEAYAVARSLTAGREIEISTQSELVEYDEATYKPRTDIQTRRRTMATKAKVFDKYSACGVLRWVGANVGTDTPTVTDSVGVMAELGVEVSRTTATIQINGGAKRGAIPTLTKAEATKVQSLFTKAEKNRPVAEPKAKKAPAKKKAAAKKASRKPITKESQVGKRKRTRKTAKAAS